MIDGLGNVSNLTLIGTGNPLGLATADRLVGPRLRHLSLFDSDDVALGRATSGYRNSGIPDVRPVLYSTDTRHEQVALITEGFGEPDTDVVILGPPAALRPDPTWTAGADLNLDQTVRAGLLDLPVIAGTCIDLLAAQGHGVLIQFTHSPKNLRKGLNPAYCATMAALDTVLGNLASLAVEKGVDVIAVRMSPEADPSSALDPALRSKAMRSSQVASLVKTAVTKTRRKAPQLQTISLPKGLGLRR